MCTSVLVYLIRALKRDNRCTMRGEHADFHSPGDKRLTYSGDQNQHNVNTNVMSDEFFMIPVRSASQLADARGRLFIVVSSETTGRDSE